MLFEMIHRTVSDERPLRIRCEDCGHGARWGRAEAIRRCRAEATPADLRDKLRCGQCGSRRVRFSI
jgi:DNA-directed RNA polymerase subunit RPC12/RpoP